jgi:cytochrome c-type biogenesis protein CcmH/NrfF
MDALFVALLAFAAGFFTCVSLVGVLIWWSFSDRRAREGEPVVSNDSERRAANILWSGR